MNLPADLHGSLPVDNIRTDFGGFIVQAWGSNPGERRRSRCELWNKNESINSMTAYPQQSFRIAKAMCFGNDGLKQIYGNIQAQQSLSIEKSKLFEEQADDNVFSWSTLRKFLKIGPELNFVNVNILNLKELKDCPPPQNGISFANDIQIPNYCKVEMLDVRLNGFPLSQSSRDGYELFPHDFGWRLRINVPPEKSSTLLSYFITAAYKTDADLSWGWQIPADVKARAQTIPDLKEHAAIK